MMNRKYHTSKLR